MRIEKLYARCSKCGDCRLWSGPTTANGRYPVMSIPGIGVRLVRRVAWAQKHGPIPIGIAIVMTCDNSLCIERAHMQPMTGSEYRAYQAERGAWRTVSHKVSTLINGRKNAKLDVEKARCIRDRIEQGHAQNAIAADFGISESAVGKIKRGTLWAPRAAPNSSVFHQAA